MDEPEKPFACTLPDCGMKFTNEDHLHVHTKKHDMVLQLGLEQKASFVADQTPTPTRFIRNCEEVGLFQDLQNVNPFDEGFKRAMETKVGVLSLDGAVTSSSSDDVLHTPQMVYPLIEDSALFTTNNQNITISRSSSDESGTIKEYETTTISKLTNQVTTISRVVEKHDQSDTPQTTHPTTNKSNEMIVHNKNLANETSVSFRKNVKTVHSNVEIRKDDAKYPVKLISYTDSVVKDATSLVIKDVLFADSHKLQVPASNPPIMSQKSLDYVVDSLASETPKKNKDENLKVMKRNYSKSEDSSSNNDSGPNKVTKKEENTSDYEVIIKLPNGKQVKMKAVDEVPIVPGTSNVIKTETIHKLKKVITDKTEVKPQIINPKIVTNVLPISSGVLYPVTVVNPSSILVTNTLKKIPIAPLATRKSLCTKPEFRKRNKKSTVKGNSNDKTNESTSTEEPKSDKNFNPDEGRENDGDKRYKKKPDSFQLASMSAASKRYRQKLKDTMRRQAEENKQLKEANQRLMAENAALKVLLLSHMKKCPSADDLRSTQEKLQKPKNV